MRLTFEVPCFLLFVFLMVFTAAGEPRPARPWVPERDLNAVWRFDSASEWLDSRTRPLHSWNIAVAEGWSGSSLRMAAEPALFALPATAASGHVHLAADSGMIRFWLAPDWASLNAGGVGPGSEAALLEVGAWDGNQGVASWSFRVSSNGNLLQCTAAQAGQRVPVLQTPIAWNGYAWHQIALAWSSSETTLFVDGKAVAKST